MVLMGEEGGLFLFSFFPHCDFDVNVLSHQMEVLNNSMSYTASTMYKLHKWPFGLLIKVFVALRIILLVTIMLENEEDWMNKGWQPFWWSALSPPVLSRTAAGSPLSGLNVTMGATPLAFGGHWCQIIRPKKPSENNFSKYYPLFKLG